MSEGSQTPAILPVTCSLKSVSLEDDIPMCRICRNTGGKQSGQEPLRRVCLCKGSMGEIHKSCLETWLTAAHADRCPICHYEFQIRRVVKPITQWRCPPMHANDISMLVFTVLFIGMFAVQLTGMVFLVSYYKQPACHATISLGLAGIGAGLPFFLALALALTVNVYFSRYWRHWRNTNRRVIVRLGNINEADIVPV